MIHCFSSKAFLLGMIFILFSNANADGPSDNLPEAVRQIPPQGITIEPAAQEALLWRCKAIRTQWESMLKKLNSLSPQFNATYLKSLEPEVLVFPRAVEIAIELNQFYRPKDLELASSLLDEATQRLIRISNGANWSQVVGIDSEEGTRSIIGGYKSDLDDSFQPYGLVLPADYHSSKMLPRRLDLWFHGRGEKVAEIHFLMQQQNGTGQYTPPSTFVLHPYGRYCNAFKFAGEIDVLEALDYLKTRLPVDQDRIGVRGFSMGGAGCWQFATHYPHLWFAANPGAGFSETPEFLRIFQNEDARLTAPEYEQTLWKLYDCTNWSRNLLNCPTIAYSGEIDKQKQAADIMAESLAKHGVSLTHIIGPETAHKIHPESKKIIEAKMQFLADNQPSIDIPANIDFTTYTLRYNKHHWVSVLGLEQHWKRSTIRAVLADSAITAVTQNISDLEFSFEAGQWKNNDGGPVKVILDGQILQTSLPRSDQSWHGRFAKRKGIWLMKNSVDAALRKKPNLQGPIDDAFMQPFVFVLPTGNSKDAAVDQWIKKESEHAMTHWRKHFRGDIRKILDSQLTESHIAQSNLILFGDLDSNSVIKKLSSQLPVRWEKEHIRVGENHVPRVGHVPILIYPNPLNQERYIVINSGFTFREYDYLNNARQTPKLPDWALVDITNGSTSQYPGKIIHADFFNEYWLPKNVE